MSTESKGPSIFLHDKCVEYAFAACPPRPSRLGDDVQTGLCAISQLPSRAIPLKECEWGAASALHQYLTVHQQLTDDDATR